MPQEHNGKRRSVNSCLHVEGNTKWHCPEVWPGVKYKWKICSKQKCCKQCEQVKFMGTMTKWPYKNTQNITKH